MPNLMTKLNEIVKNALNKLHCFDWITAFYSSEPSLYSDLKSDFIQKYPIGTVKEMCNELSVFLSSSSKDKPSEEIVHYQLIILMIYYTQIPIHVLSEYISFGLSNLFIPFTHIKASVLDELEKDNEFLDVDLSKLIILTPKEIYWGMKKWNLSDFDVRRVIKTCSLNYPLTLELFKKDDIEGFSKSFDLGTLDNLTLNFLQTSLKYVYHSLLDNAEIDDKFSKLIDFTSLVYDSSLSEEIDNTLKQCIYNEDGLFDLSYLQLKIEEWVQTKESTIRNQIDLFEDGIGLFQLAPTHHHKKDSIKNEIESLLYFKEQLEDSINDYPNNKKYLFDDSICLYFLEAYVDYIINQISLTESKDNEVLKKIAEVLTEFLVENLNFRADIKKYFWEEYLIKLALYISSIQNQIDWLILAHLFYPSYPKPRSSQDKVKVHLEGGMSWKTEPKNLMECMDKLNEAFGKFISCKPPRKYSYTPTKISLAIAKRAVTCDWIINFTNDFWPIQDNKIKQLNQNEEACRYSPREKILELYKHALKKRMKK